MRINRKSIIGLTTVIIPLILGALLYYIICPEVYFVRMVDQYTKFNMHIKYNTEQNILVKVLRNYFFDFIWAFSFTNALGVILDNDTKAYLKCCFISVLVGSFFELLQMVGVAYGTYDVWDILSEVLGAASAVLIIKRIRRKRYEKN